MKRLVVLTGLCLALLAPSVHAVQVELGETLRTEVELVPGWTVSREPPAELVEELAEHLGHEAGEQGKQPDRQQLLAAARMRLAANEAFIVHSSGAHLLCDASPLDAGTSAPSASGLRLSADYASGSLQGEEGVSDYRSRISEVALPGVSHAVRLDSDYRQHGQPKKFIGIISFAAGHWLFLYYTDPLADPRAYPEMEAMLAGMRIREQGH